MSNKDDGLSQLVQDVIDGKAEKKELCNKIYKEVYEHTLYIRTKKRV